MDLSLDIDNDSKFFSDEELYSIDPTRVPKHIAMILDGNRRWARQKNAPKVTEGHRMGADVVLDIVKAAKELGVKTVTLYVFSTENWLRERSEVLALMWMFETYIRHQTPEMVKHQIRFNTIGDLSRFSESIQDAIEHAKLATKECRGLDVVFAMNYGARDEIKRAIQKMIQDHLSPDEITETKIASYLDTAQFPDPDLLIRTGGDDRISNFLLWQLSYAEFYITNKLWPDFRPIDLLNAITEYQERERRLGL